MLNKCCESNGSKLSPKRPRRGRFAEVHTCPKCGTKIRVTFEEIATLGNDGNSEFVIVAIDPIQK